MQFYNDVKKRNTDQSSTHTHAHNAKFQQPITWLLTVQSEERERAPQHQWQERVNTSTSPSAEAETSCWQCSSFQTALSNRASFFLLFLRFFWFSHSVRNHVQNDCRHSFCAHSPHHMLDIHTSTLTFTHACTHPTIYAPWSTKLSSEQNKNMAFFIHVGIKTIVQNSSSNTLKTHNHTCDHKNKSFKPLS